MCWCCGKNISQVEAKQVHECWDGRLDGYCYSCASNRCDAYPEDCPRNPLNQLNRRQPKARTAV